MVSFPPYLASSAWYYYWLRSFLKTGGDNRAVTEANIAAPPAKDLARCVITASHNDTLQLSLPVEGGARKLRQRSLPDTVNISRHGDWRKNHISAIEASYGKYPFFSHIFPLLKEVYADERADTLNEFNLKLHQVSASLLTRELTSEESKIIDSNPLFIGRGKEIAIKIKPEISIIDPLMHYGPEAILGIFALYR